MAYGNTQTAVMIGGATIACGLLAAWLTPPTTPRPMIASPLAAYKGRSPDLATVDNSAGQASPMGTADPTLPNPYVAVPQRVSLQKPDELGEAQVIRGGQSESDATAGPAVSDEHVTDEPRSDGAASADGEAERGAGDGPSHASQSDAGQLSNARSEYHPMAYANSAIAAYQQDRARWLDAMKNAHCDAAAVRC